MKSKIIAFIALCCVLAGAITIYVNNDNEKGEIPVLMYHNLKAGANTLGTITPARFEEQIKELTEEGYTGISMQELYDYLDGKGELPEKPIVITFDNGYLSNYEFAYPVLKKYKMKATAFVMGNRIFEADEENLFKGEIPKMTWDQLREMQDYVTVQSHTYAAHVSMTMEDGTLNGSIYGPGYVDGEIESMETYEARVREDFDVSRKLIEEKLGYEPIAIAYPYGSYSEDTIRLAKEAGFKMGFQVGENAVKKGDDIFALNRITADGHYTGKQLIKEIEKKLIKE